MIIANHTSTQYFSVDEVKPFEELFKCKTLYEIGPLEKNENFTSRLSSS